MKLKIEDKYITLKNANTFFKRFFGLMGKRSFQYGIYFPKVNSVHTFFMKENIDIIAINEENEIIFKSVNTPKNKIITINNKIKNTSIIEMPAFGSKNLKIGDKLTFISE